MKLRSIFPLVSLAAACASNPPARQPQTAQYPQYPQQPYPPQYPQQPYPQYPQQPYPQQPAPQYPVPIPAPAPSVAPSPAPAPAPAPQRPLLPPLVGTLAWQAEVRSVIAEDIAALAPENQARVRGIPIVFDPNPFEINAYASCDNNGQPAITGTEGLLEAIDAIAQTRATDDLYGTRTYDAYTAAVMPNLARSDKASAALPIGIIPAQYLADPRRLSRAHERFDEIVAFTFGHELSHHYLGHTGCANGAPVPFGGIAQIAGAIGHGFAQPLEIAADSAGMVNMLDAGRARQPKYRWTEEGGLALLDFFGRLEDAAGPMNPLGAFVVNAFLRDHPNPKVRVPIVQAVARTWYAQHPT